MARSSLSLSQCLTQTMKVRIGLWTWLAVDSEMRAQSEGFTFTGALVRANLLSETVLAGVVGLSELPFRKSSFFIFASFSYRK